MPKTAAFQEVQILFPREAAILHPGEDLTGFFGESIVLHFEEVCFPKVLQTVLRGMSSEFMEIDGFVDMGEIVVKEVPRWISLNLLKLVLEELPVGVRLFD